MTWVEIGLIEVVCFVAGLLVVGIALYRKQHGKHDSVTSGVSASISLLSYAWHQKKLLTLATIRIASFLCVLPFFGKDGYRLFTHAKDSIGLKFLEIFVLIALMFVCFFLSNIFELMATHSIFAELDKQPTTFKASFHKAWNTKWMVFKFTLLDFLMSFLTRRGRSEDGATERKPSAIALFATIFAALAALSWKVATYFIMPVLSEEKDSIISAIKKSARTMKESFGHVVGFHLGVAALDAVLICVALAPMLIIFLAMWISVSLKIVRARYFIFPFVLSLTFAAGCGIMLAIIHTVMQWIFTCLAYNYTQNKSTGPFDKDFIRSAIETK
jgi:hypothetical protein